MRTVLKSFVGNLQNQSMLRVHSISLGGCDPEEGSIKQSDILFHEVAFLGVDLLGVRQDLQDSMIQGSTVAMTYSARTIYVRMVVSIWIKPRIRNPRPSRSGVAQDVPETLGSVGISRKPEAHANNGDRLLLVVLHVQQRGLFINPGVF